VADEVSPSEIKLIDKRDEPSNAIGPSTEPATNLLIADIVLRSASSLFRKNVERRVAKANYGAETGDEIIDGRTILTSLALYGASKIATRSVPGLAIVAGGLVLKTLYDRGRSREIENARED